VRVDEAWQDEVICEAGLSHKSSFEISI